MQTSAMFTDVLKQEFIGAIQDANQQWWSTYPSGPDTSKPKDHRLSKGKHRRRSDGMCAMEWVAYVAGEPHSDHPTCVAPDLRSLMVCINDALPDEQRQLLRPYLARCIGTAGTPGAERSCAQRRFLLQCHGLRGALNGAENLVVGMLGGDTGQAQVGQLCSPPFMGMLFAMLDEMLPTVYVADLSEEGCRELAALCEA